MLPIEEEILKFIEEYAIKKKRPPTVRDILEGVGLSSTSVVQRHLDNLIEQGYLFREPHKARTLVVLSGPS